MPKFKSQHPATCWAIDVTQISREGVLQGRATLPDSFVIQSIVKTKRVVVEGSSDALLAVEAHQVEREMAQGRDDAGIAADAGGVLAEALDRKSVV